MIFVIHTFFVFVFGSSLGHSSRRLVQNMRSQAVSIDVNQIMLGIESGWQSELDILLQCNGLA